MTDRKTIAVDLDGTLAQYDGWKGIEHIGDPLPGAMEKWNRMAEDYDVIVFTTRTNKDVNLDTIDELTFYILEWLERWGFSDKIGVYSGCGKPLADLYVDDRAFHHPTNSMWTGEEMMKIKKRLED